MGIFVLTAESSWVEEGLTALISGLLTVFVILILISIVISFFKYIKEPEAKVEAAPMTKDLKVQNTGAKQIRNQAESNEEDEEILIAVLTAAIAASLGTAADGLRVRAFRRISTEKIERG